MGFVDLHVHSNASNGTFSPFEAARLAARTGLDAIALTDHDTTAGIAEASRAGVQYGVEVVPGIKVPSSYQEREIHILELFVHPEDPALEHVLEQFRERRDERNREMLRRFAADGITLTNEELCAGNPNTVITRAYVARAFPARGLASSMDQVFKRYFQYDRRYCSPKAYLSPSEVMDVLLPGGAFVALAYPFQYKPGDKGTQELTAFPTGIGMKGLKVYHSSHNRLESMKLQAMAPVYGLFSTGGLDFHGSNKSDISIGWGRGGSKVSSLLLDDAKKAR